MERHRPLRNPNAIPELRIHTSSDEDSSSDDDDDEKKNTGHGIFNVGTNTSAYTPVTEELKLPGGRILIKENKVHRLVMDESAPICCWWCCQLPDKPERYYAVSKYVPIKHLYHVYGCFCTLNCSKAYILDKRLSNTPKVITWFTQMCKEVYKIPIKTHIRPSPPRQMLKMFGGPLSPEEFHEKTLTVNMHPIKPPFFVDVQEVHEVIHRETKLQDEIRKKHAASERKASSDIRPVQESQKRAHDPSAADERPKRFAKSFQRRDRKEPVKHQPLKLLRNTRLPGSHSTLSNFMNITTTTKKQ